MAGKYRNDFSLSIAHQLQTGYTDNINVFDHALPSLSTDDTIYRVKDNTLYIRYRYGETYNAVRIKDTNLHCMNKLCLSDPEIKGALEDYAT